MKLPMRDGISLAGTLVVLGAAAFAGPSSPPVGPITGAYKTLSTTHPMANTAN